VIDRVADVEYTMTDSVGEALLLEGNLVKRFQPPFNVRLKDDKSYPYIKITLNDDFPRIERTRKLPNDGSRYFGPYASASSVDEAMNLVRRLFPFRTCTIDIKEGTRALQRPCLLYHIKRCQGPCIEAISKDAYRADIDQVQLFLEGRQESLVKALGEDMRRASDRQDYEHAGITRDKIKAIERTMESQKMAAFARTDLDLLGLARRDNQAAVQLFVIRGGKALGRDVFLLDTPRGTTDAEVVSGFLLQYYARATSIPREIAIPLELPERRTSSGSSPSAAARALGRRRTGRARRALAQPHREPDRPAAGRGARHAAARPRGRDAAGPARRAPAGRATQLMQLATRNAEEMLAREQARWLADQGKTLGALEELADALSLPAFRRESSATTSRTSRASETVASMVVFRGRQAADGEYRRFRVRTVEGPNDVASHREFFGDGSEGHVPATRAAPRSGRWAMPGPRDHRRRASRRSARQGRPRRARPALTCRSPASPSSARSSSSRIAPNRRCCPRPRRPCTSSSASATRPTAFAITYHRELRRKASVRSKFDDLPGIGPRRRGALLRVFGSMKRVREAPVEQIAAVPGIGPALAQRIKAALEA
jgi:excinuclease ABC subunit C